MIALVEGFLSTGDADHLGEIAASGITEDADPGRIYAILGRVSPQVTYCGLAVLQQRREPVRDDTILGGGNDEAGRGQSRAQLEVFLMISRVKPPPGKYTIAGFLSLVRGTSSDMRNCRIARIERIWE